MWNPSEEVSHPQQVYHHPKEGTPSYHPHWYRYPTSGDPLDQPDSSLVDYSTDLSADMQPHSRDAERPFKAYPRAPVTLPSSYYGTQPAFPGPMSMSTMGGDRDYSSQVTSTCSSVPPVAPVTSMSSLGPPAAHPLPPPSHHPLSHSLHSSSSHPSPDSQSQTSAGIMEISSSMSLKRSPGGHDRIPGHNSHPETNGNFSENSTSPPATSGASSSHDSESPVDKSDTNGFKVPPKKRPHTIPDMQKDSTYWEKRKKNNESAKRSREARRMKEEQIAMRVVYLEQENLQLRTELSLLKSEIEKLRCMLYNS